MTVDLSQFSLKESFKDNFKGTPLSRPPRSPRISNLRDASAPFIKGPIPLVWMKAVAMLPGKSLHVGLALWYLAGVKKTKTVALGNHLLESFGVDRKTKSRGLRSMERAGLIGVTRRAGCNPIVTLLDAPEAWFDGGVASVADVGTPSRPARKSASVAEIGKTGDLTPIGFIASTTPIHNTS